MRAARAGLVLIDGLVASAVVWLAALPLVAMRFHLVSPIGVLLNIPLIPFTTAAMMLGGLGLVLSIVWGPLGGPFAWGAAGLLKVTKAIVLWGAERALGAPLRGRAGMGLGAGLLCLAGPGGGGSDTTDLIRQAHRVAAPQGGSVVAAGRVGACRAGCWRRGSQPLKPTMNVDFLSVGHGLAVVIRTPEGQAYLYDCGRMGDPDRRPQDRRAGALGARESAGSRRCS